MMFRNINIFESPKIAKAMYLKKDLLSEECASII